MGDDRFARDDPHAPVFQIPNCSWRRKPSSSARRGQPGLGLAKIRPPERIPTQLLARADRAA
jgi:hypothetical protein